MQANFFTMLFQRITVKIFGQLFLEEKVPDYYTDTFISFFFVRRFSCFETILSFRGRPTLLFLYRFAG